MVQPSGSDHSPVSWQLISVIVTVPLYPVAQDVTETVPP